MTTITLQPGDSITIIAAETPVDPPIDPPIEPPNGYRNVLTMPMSFPAPGAAANYGRTVQHGGLWTNDLLVVPFDAPPDCLYLSLDITPDGGQIPFQWAVNTKAGVFEGSVFGGDGRGSLSFNFSTIPSQYTNDHCAPGPYYLNLRYDQTSPAQVANLVVVMNRPSV